LQPEQPKGQFDKVVQKPEMREKPKVQEVQTNVLVMAKVLATVVQVRQFAGHIIWALVERRIMDTRITRRDFVIEKNCLDF